jgi:(2Fe-2S) ferredoxin
MKSQEERKKLAKKIAKRTEKRPVIPTYHVVFCNQSGCCKDKDEAKSVEKILNRGAKKLALKGIGIEVTSADCLNLCVGGPIVVVYPEGVWYGAVTPEICDQIIESHLARGIILDEFVVAHRPLITLKP